MGNIKDEIKLIRKFNVEDRAKLEIKRNDGIGCFVGILFLIIGIFYWGNAPSGEIKMDANYNTYTTYEDGSIYNTFSPFIGFVLICIVGLVVWGIISYAINEHYKEYNAIVKAAREEQSKIRANKIYERRKAEREQKEEAYETAINNLTMLYGQEDRRLVVGDDLKIDEQIIVFGKAKHVSLMGKDLPFDNILNCSLSDNPTVTKGKITSVTTTDNGNMVKRAIVGDLVAGGIGAAIGGSTASKNTTYTQEADKVSHDYTVIINVQDIVSPLIKINVGGREMLANEIVGLMNAIISMK